MVSRHELSIEDLAACGLLSEISEEYIVKCRGKMLCQVTRQTALDSSSKTREDELWGECAGDAR